MKNLVVLTLFLLVFSFLASGQETKTILVNANAAITCQVIVGDSMVIAGGRFTEPYNHIVAANVATGKVIPLGNGLPDTVDNVFFIPWMENMICATSNTAPFIYNYDLNSPSLGWVADIYFNITSQINDVATLPDRVALATNEGTLVKTASTSEWFTADLNYSTQKVEFNHSTSDGTLYVCERTGSSTMDYTSQMYKISVNEGDGTKVLVSMNFVTQLFYLSDMDWYKGKLLVVGEIATIPDNGIHTEMATLSSGGTWQTFSHGSCPGVRGLSVSGDDLYVTGAFYYIDDTEVGPVVAHFDGSDWLDPFPPHSAGVGFTIVTESNGKWTSASGSITTTLNPTYGLTQLLIFGTDIPEEFTGIEESNPNSFEVNLFPNPANDHIQINGPRDAIIAIYNLMGQIVYTGITNTRIEIDLPAGQYVARIQDEDVAVNKVFIVVH